MARLGPMQDVTLRLIAQRLVRIGPSSPTLHPGGTSMIETTRVMNMSMRSPVGDAEELYVRGDAVHTPSTLRPLSAGRTYHLFVSEHNAGADALVDELRATRGLTALQWTSRLEELLRCEAMLVYLTAATWTRGEASDAFAREVESGMRGGMRLVLAHEMPGIGQEGRDAMPFERLFDASQTPAVLKNDLRIYSEVAVPLKGAAWRETSMALLATKVGECETSSSAACAPPAVCASLAARIRAACLRAAAWYKGKRTRGSVGETTEGLGGTEGDGTQLLHVQASTKSLRALNPTSSRL
jgi:hypothetical protein